MLWSASTVVVILLVWYVAAFLCLASADLVEWLSLAWAAMTWAVLAIFLWETLSWSVLAIQVLDIVLSSSIQWILTCWNAVGACTLRWLSHNYIYSYIIRICKSEINFSSPRASTARYRMTRNISYETTRLNSLRQKKIWETYIKHSPFF